MKKPESKFFTNVQFALTRAKFHSKNRPFRKTASLLAGLFFLLWGAQLHAAMSITFGSGGFTRLDPSESFVDYSGEIIHWGAAAGIYVFSWTQSINDDFNLINPVVSVNAISQAASTNHWFSNPQIKDLAISGIVPSGVDLCDEAKIIFSVTPITGGPAVATFTYTVHVGDGPLDRFDLMVRDDDADIGTESYTAANEFFSPDLWVRRQNDGLTTHQNPDFVSINGNANKVFTRVQNVGCINSSPADLRLYWTRARTHETWDDHWLHYTNPSAPNNFTIWPTNGGSQRPLGGEITIVDPTNGASASNPVTLPVIGPGQTHVISPVDYFPPNPIWYKNDGDPIVAVDGAIHPAICLLARIESSADPMANEHNPRDIVFNVRDNNNIAARNTYVTNDPAFIIGPSPNGNYNYGWTSYAVNNPTGTVEIVDLGLGVHSDDTENPFQEYGNVNIALSNGLWAAWQAGGFKGSGIQMIAPGLVRLTDPVNGRLSDIRLNPGDDFQIAFQYDFFGSAAVNEDLVYDFELTQYPTGSQTAMGSPNHMITIVERQTNKQATPNPVNVDIQDLKAYPNPAGGATTISFTLKKASEISLILRDLQGREVVRLANRETFSTGQHSLPLSLESLASGTYFLHLQTPNGLLTQKIVHAGSDY